MDETSWKLSTQFDRLLRTKPIEHFVRKERQAAMCHDVPHFLWLKLETGQFYFRQVFGHCCFETKGPFISLHHRVSHHTSSNGRWTKTKEILTSIEQVEKHGIECLIVVVAI